MTERKRPVRTIFREFSGQSVIARTCALNRRSVAHIGDKFDAHQPDMVDWIVIFPEFFSSSFN